MGMTVEQKLVSVMLKLKKIRPFYGIIYSHLEKVEFNEYCPTMGVNSRQLLYNSEFVEKTPLDEFIFINLHEVAHISLLHPSRIGERDPQLFNIACDLYVNALLCDELGIRPGESTEIEGITIKVPKNLVYDSSINPNVDYVEGIYEKLRNNSIKTSIRIYMPGMNGSNSDGTDNSLSDCIGQDIFKDTDKNAQDKIKKVIIDAVTRAKLMSSNGNGNLLLHVEEALAPKVDWRSICKKYLIADMSKETSFKTTDKRMSYQDCIFPGSESLDNFKLESLKICIDTSGSIGGDDLGIFYSQVKQLLKKFKVDAEVLYWGTSIESKGNFKNYKDFSKIDVMGGGGTDPSCLFEYFNSKSCKVKPKLTIIFTDGYIYNNNLEKYGRKYKDTVWIIVPSGNKAFKAPFGKAVKFNK